MTSSRRAMLLGGALASTLALSLASGTAAFASISLQDAAHAYNASPTTNQCLAAAADDNDANAIVWACDSEAGQQWMEEPPNAAYQNNLTYFTIENDNGSCLGVAGGSGTPGASVVAWSCDSTKEQDWSTVAWSGEYQEIKNAQSGECLDVTGSNSSGEGAQVIQEGCIGVDSQLWYMPSS